MKERRTPKSYGEEFGQWVGGVLDAARFWERTGRNAEQLLEEGEEGVEKEEEYLDENFM
ncbi:CobQ/CobB/MinD/ParA nucleotide binding domain-containing protein [Anopheles sinensis]|uniref:CobQ/CobB/MinD/ParA nucleotide binding domain-containing protein n=1 Tax=Anopheles sinensis TaxID=74873 RepID=A0A084VB21_ANOSI|nr:CobQ/CobB/MinD/ParA nucleotide binding domain-containing protein [Anopheles sinensis]